jgi:hypothetical protein
MKDATRPHKLGGLTIAVIWRNVWIDSANPTARSRAETPAQLHFGRVITNGE